MMLFGEKYGEQVRVVEVPDVLARAVRRHARALDRRDRRVRDPARGQLVAGRPPDRGDHVARGDRPSARAGGRGRAGRRREVARAASPSCAGPPVAVAAASNQATAARPAWSSRPRSRTASGSWPPSSTTSMPTRCSPSPTGVKARLAPAVVVLGSATEGKVHLVARSTSRGRPRPLGRRPDPRDRADRGRRRGRPADDGPRRRPRPGAAGRGHRRGRDARSATRLSAPGMKVLALDYGRARTGLAVSDATGMLARPLGVVERVGTRAGHGTS